MKSAGWDVLRSMSLGGVEFLCFSAGEVTAGPRPRVKTGRPEGRGWDSIH